MGSHEIVQNHVEEHHPDTTSCPLCNHTLDTNDYTLAPKLMKQHLQQKHPTTTYHHLSDQQLKERGLRICRTCNCTAKIFTRYQDLKRHRTHEHSADSAATTPTNLDLLTQVYRHANPSQWEAALSFLHTLQPSPVTWRTGLWKDKDKPNKDV